MLRGFSLSPDFVPKLQQYLVLQELHRVVSNKPETKVMSFPMAWEVDDSEPMDDFNSDYGCIHEDDCYDDYNREYIKSTVAVDFLPYIGLLVWHWPSFLATGTKNTTGFIFCPFHHNFKYDKENFKFKNVQFVCRETMDLRMM